MFLLSKLEASVRVAPHDLAKPPALAVAEALERAFIDRVVADLGLVVTIYDILSVGGGRIYPNDGAAYFKVVFRPVVFRPAPGEFLLGTILGSSSKGIRVSLGGFFDDVSVPDYQLQDPSLFDPQEAAWKWVYDGAEMFMDAGEAVRLRVTGVNFNPPPPAAHAQAAEPGGEPPVGTAARPYRPMEVMGDMCGDGLGLTSWWEDDGGEADAEADGVEALADGEAEGGGG